LVEHQLPLEERQASRQTVEVIKTKAVRPVQSQSQSAVKRRKENVPPSAY